MNEGLRRQILSIIDDCEDMTIATIRPDGFPQATTVSYVNDGLVIYFITTTDSQKAHNIAQDNKVSLTINRHYEIWDDIQGISMGAFAALVTDADEKEKIGDLLMEKFPQAANYGPVSEVELAFFRLEPKVISILDYKKGFGHTELIEV